MRSCVLLLYLFIKFFNYEGVNAYTVYLKIHFDLPFTITDQQYNLDKLANKLVNDTRDFFTKPIWTDKNVIELSLVEYDVYRSDIMFDKQTNKTVKSASYDLVKSYCQCQKDDKKFVPFFSVLVTGLDLYTKSGDVSTITQSLIYPNITSVCNISESCTAIRFRPDDMGYLLAHQIGHSLGMPHDGPGTKCDNEYSVMVPEYEPKYRGIPKFWSKCSKTALDTFLQSSYGGCLSIGAKKLLRDKTLQCMFYTEKNEKKY